MANFVDSLDEDTTNDEFQAEAVKAEAPTQEPVIPEKYKGKSLDDIIRMHQEAEKLIGRQAQEVGEVRKLADELIKRQITPQETAHKTIEDDTDFFADPVKAVHKAVETHPAVLQAQQAAAQMARMQTANRLAQTHPDYSDISSDPEFAEWVKSSPVRQRLYIEANNQFDFDSANELLTNFKALKRAKQETVQQAAQQLEDQRERTLKAATVSIDGATGEQSKKIYRRQDLIRLQLTDPDRYMALQDDIMLAYSEGRVR
ncbi:MAG: hypothetical protein EBR82_57330 [Caulobacteraceae bacterium]|jgi:hypothetical protein|nr:hypothetical protein [Caulobacteraceae bacterium]